METNDQSLNVIDLMLCPGFCVQGQKIIRVNDGARRCFLEPGMEILPLIAAGRREYEEFQDGCLCLTLALAGKEQSASVTRIGDTDVFIADEEEELRELQVLALAAQELRMPLANVILSSDLLSRSQDTEENKETAARLNRGTSQLQRLIGNMSDALRYAEGAHLQFQNISALLSEIFQKAQDLCARAGVSLQYEGTAEDVFMMTDAEQLERAVYNLISNALKFTPKGGRILARSVRKKNVLQLTVADSGCGIADSILKNIFSRYLRTPSLEDSRLGLGLGMVLIRAAAKNHGGTVLVERMQEGTKVSLTLAILENSSPMLKSPILTVDYAGEREHGLLELSESLPADLYL